MAGSDATRPTRRQVCAGFLGIGLGAALAGCRSPNSPDTSGPSETSGASARGAGAAAPPARFDHGVASFDPSAEGVLLWTRVSGVDEPVELEVRVARDPGLRDAVASETVVATPDADHTAVAPVAGLDPATTYYYRFSAGGAPSAVGRTRTLPAGAVDRARLGVVSCANYAYGYFAAYRELAGRGDLDAVVHLGDYVYEFGPGTYDDPDLERGHDPPHETVTLSDYRRRYAQYRRDPDLQELHRQHPVFALWDDHEFADNAHRSGAANHQRAEGSWGDRRAAAARAFSEWLPVRSRDAGEVYRSARFGDLAELVLLDTRHAGRDEPPSRLGRRGEDPDRQLLGARQEAWAGETLRRAARDGVAWRLVGQQVMVAPLTLGGRVLNVDQWDGYPRARQRLLDLLAETGDAVVLTGDIHSSWANDLPPDPALYDPETGTGSVAVELVAPAVTSPALDGIVGAAAGEAAELLPHVRWADLVHRGFVVVDVGRDRVQGDWYHLDDVSSRRGRARFSAGFATRAGSAHLEPVSEPAAAGPVRVPAP